MTGFSFSAKSEERLKEVYPALATLTRQALSISRVDFGVTCGLRSMEEQKRLVQMGRSKTLKSKHLPQDDGFAYAVDLLAYLDGQPCWEVPVYFHIVKAMMEVGDGKLSVRWGGAWLTKNILICESPEKEQMEYIDFKRRQGKMPFLDCPHFEVS